MLQLLAITALRNVSASLGSNFEPVVLIGGLKPVLHSLKSSVGTRLAE